MMCAGRAAVALVVMSVAVQMGCEDAPPPPPPQVQQRVQETQAAPSEPDRPTTQELVAGPRRRINLASWPLSMEVPLSWEIDSKNAKGFIFLEGHAPGGMVQIQLAQRPTLNPEQLQHMIDAAKRDVAADPRSKKTVELREGKQFKLLERKGQSPTVMLNVVDEDGQIREVPHTPYSWTINVLVSQDKTMFNYELNFFDLTLEQYEADRAFLEKIVDTLQLESIAGPAIAPPAS